MYILTDIITFYNYFLNYSLPQARYLHIYVYSCIQIGDIFGNYVVKSFVFQTKYFSVLPLFCFRTSTFAISISVFFSSQRLIFVNEQTDLFGCYLFQASIDIVGKPNFKTSAKNAWGLRRARRGLPLFSPDPSSYFRGLFVFSPSVIPGNQY